MNQTPEPPAGTIIRVRSEPDGDLFYWRQPHGGAFRYAIAAFLVLWLCGWVVGESFAIHELLVERDEGETTDWGFLLVWLTGWSIGGGVAMWLLYRLLRSPRPESVLLGFDSFRYDSGDTFLMFLANPWSAMAQTEHWSFPWRRRRRISLSKSEAGPFVLERAGEHQRLRFDHGADRVEIGRHLREPEREWLTGVIEAWYAQRRPGLRA